mgnify:CR=1 FL=1
MTNGRRRIRRPRGGGATASDLDLQGNPDEDFEDIDESAAGPNDAVRDMVSRVAVPDPPDRTRRAMGGNRGGGDAGEMDEDAASPGGRLAAVARDTPEYDREYRLSLIGRLLMRRIPLDQIARQLNVSVSTVKRDRAEFQRRIRSQASTLNVTEIVGETIAYYQEIGGNALRIASMEKTPQPTKLAALRTAAMARKEMLSGMTTAGVFDALKFEPGTDSTSDDMQKLVAAAMNALGEEGDAVDEAMDEIDSDMDDVYLL